MAMTRNSMFLRMTVSSLIRRRSRMLVALLAVGLGATILSGLVTLYRDVPAQMSEAFRSYGANLIITPAAGVGSISAEQFAKIKSAIPEDKVVGLTPFLYKNVRLHDIPFMAAGTIFEDVKKTSPYWYIDGEWPQDDDSIIIGREVAQRISLVRGDNIKITGLKESGEKFEKSFAVSGIVQTGSNEEEYVYMDIKVLEGLFGVKDEYDVIECSISMPKDELVAEAAELAVADSAINPRLITRLAQSEGKVLEKLQSLVYIVTLVVLALTMVCVATTMMAVVAERRSEIGLRKALGASNANIMSEFMSESLMLGTFGGILGAICGYFFALYVSNNVFGHALSMDPFLTLATVIVSIIITGVSSYVPIVKASKVDPVIVLRGE